MFIDLNNHDFVDFDDIDFDVFYDSFYFFDDVVDFVHQQTFFNEIKFERHSKMIFFIDEK